jgi:hypothetical protein
MSTWASKKGKKFLVNLTTQHARAHYINQLQKIFSFFTAPKLNPIVIGRNQ